MIKNLNIQYFWEHHICYFDRNSIKHFIEQFNLDIIKIKKYNQTSEDNIVIIAQFKKNFIRKIMLQKIGMLLGLLITYFRKYYNIVLYTN
jgi:methionine synthase II (cobalamin-independent)